VRYVWLNERVFVNIRTKFLWPRTEMFEAKPQKEQNKIKK
jgi:hypothetical protein